MGTITEFFQIISAFAFLFYGFACLMSSELVVEFERYRLSKFRVLTGVLEVLGAIGLLVGFVFPPQSLA